MGQTALSGVIGALSHALDIAEGQPPGHAVRSCVIGMRLADELDLPDADRADLFYALLLKDAGCSANANRMAALFAADDRAAKATSKLVDWSNPRASLLWSLRTVAPGAGLRRRVQVLRGIRDEGDVTRQFMEARCDRGAEIARMLFLSEQTAAAIRSLDEHWDGRGMPDGLTGEEIPFAARILCMAQTVEVFHATGGVKAARAMAKRRRGRWFDPAIVDAFLNFCDEREFWAALEAPDVSQWEPADLALAGDEDRLDRIAEAFARVIDAKSPFTARHSQRVAEIADGIATALSFDADERRVLRRAALLHDIGKIALPDTVLMRPGVLMPDALEDLKPHAVLGEQILDGIEFLRPAALIVRHHHERFDGSGYPDSLTSESIPLGARLFSIVDALDAITNDQNYRAAQSFQDAVEEIARWSGRQFDPYLVAQFRQIPPEEWTQIRERIEADADSMSNELSPQDSASSLP